VDLNGKTGRSAIVELLIALVLAALVFVLTALQFFKEYRAEMRGGAILLVIAALLHLGFPWITKDFLRRWLAPVALMLGAVGLFLATRWFEPKPKALLYISPVPQLSHQPFYGEFVDELLHQAKQRGFDVTVWLPNKDFDPQSQKDLLLAAQKQQKQYAAVILSPFIINPEEDEDALLDFFTKSQDLSVILFDMDLSNSLQQQLESRGLDIPPCVKGDEIEGGRLAAQATLDYCYSKKLMKPRTVVFDRQRGGSQRGDEYKARLNQGESGVKPIITRWLTTRYSRDEGFQNTLRELSGGKEVDTIFAANDVSALGARDAIRQLRNRKPPLATKSIRIIGYDGTDEVSRLLQDPNEELLLNSVDVRLPDQVAGIMWLVDQLLSNKQNIPHSRGRRCIEKQPRLLRAVALPAN